MSGLPRAQQINFPCMPDSIELARSAEYLVTTSPVAPDGIHTYTHTNPLTIPFSFKVHAFDKQFCPQGVLSLLQMAALLHAFELPISASGRRTSVTAGQAKPGAAPSGASDAQSANAQGANTPAKVGVAEGAEFYPPVTLILQIIFLGEQNPGIMCVGYVKDVRVKLLGPWLRGRNSNSRAQNLPTSAEFDFTFVHVPGYGNGFNVAPDTTAQGDTTQGQAYADDVAATLYNTRMLSVISEQSYQALGGGGGGASTATPAAAATPQIAPTFSPVD